MAGEPYRFRQEGSRAIRPREPNNCSAACESRMPCVVLDSLLGGDYTRCFPYFRDEGQNQPGQVIVPSQAT